MKLTSTLPLTLLLISLVSGQSQPATILQRDSEASTQAVLRTQVELTPSLCEGLSRIPGVETLHCSSRYSATLSRGDLFTWEEVEPAVIQYLRQAGSDATTK